jgi:ubiquinol-cytochrome c reductase iron-sulfur subunit
VSTDITPHGPTGSEVDVTADPIADPGLPAHLPRPTDVDPRAERRAERQVATFFGLSSLMAVLFVVCYFAFSVGGHPDLLAGFALSNLTLGATLGLCFMLLGIGIIHWARKLMSDHEIVENRHPVASSAEDRAEAVNALRQGVEESTIMRRPLVRNSLLGAMGTLALPLIIPLRDLAPGDALSPSVLEHTVWRKGVRVVRDVSGEPISAADLQMGELVNAEPDLFFHPDAYGAQELSYDELQAAKAKAAVVVVKMDPDEIKPWKGRENWSYGGIMVYSKICTHVGCPISLYEQQTHHMLCPCHQSTFDLADNGRVIFGPAGRSLPQLPITVDAQGYVIAQSDFTEPVGPSYWGRDNTK